MMQIYLNMSREKVQTFSYHEKWGLISVNDPCHDMPDIQCGNLHTYLKLTFQDVDEGCDGWLFDDEDAIKIKNYIEANSHLPLIVIHCYAGVSRSAAIAAALSKHYNGSDKMFFQRYTPNALVYRKLLNVLCNTQT